MNLSGLPTELETFVQQEIAEGKYQSVEEVISTALRLLQARNIREDCEQPSTNGDGQAPLRSASDMVRAITEALATGQHGLARQLAMDGAKLYPDDGELQNYNYLLSPPSVGKITSATPESRAALKANNAWVKTHWQAYRGHWIALRAGHLLHASPSFDEVVNQVGDVRGRNILLTKIN